MLQLAFNHIKFRQREVDASRHFFDTCSQLSIRQRREFVEQRCDIVGINSDHHLQLIVNNIIIRHSLDVRMHLGSYVFIYDCHWAMVINVHVSNKSCPQTLFTHTHAAYQWHDENKQPGVDEEVVAADLYDVDEKRRDRHRQRHRHQQLLDVVFEEKSNCLEQSITELHCCPSRLFSFPPQQQNYNDVAWTGTDTCWLKPCFSSITKVL